MRLLYPSQSQNEHFSQKGNRNKKTSCAFMAGAQQQKSRAGITTELSILQHFCQPGSADNFIQD